MCYDNNIMDNAKVTPRILLSVAVGDAYGAGFEFETPEVVERENNGRHYRKRAGFTPGHYTDDTQMTLTVSAPGISIRRFSPASSGTI